MNSIKKTKRIVTISHPFGNANVRAVLKALKDSDHLEKFWTTVGISKQGGCRYAPRPLQSEFHKRSFDLDPLQIETHSLREIVRHLAKKSGFQYLTRHESGWASIDQVWRSLDRHVARNLQRERIEGDIVYAYEDGALETFRAAKKRGMKSVYDLPIGYWKMGREIYRQERESNPEFAPMLGGVLDSDEKCERKEEEVSLADQILACSPFVRKSLIDYGVDERRIKLVQFGAPQGVPVKSWDASSDQKNLKLLFVGRMDQRKGIGYLLRVMRSLGKHCPVDLHVIGELPHDMTPLIPYRDQFTHEASLSQERVFQRMREADLLVLPTLFEGQALVVLEAMAAGIPVLVTRSSGAEEVVRDGVEGWVIKSQNEDALKEKLEWAIANRSLLPEMGRTASQRAKEFTWDAYGEEVLRIILEAV